MQLLDLFFNNLTTLPEWLGDLTQLQNLNLSFNNLTSFPPCIKTLLHLKSLGIFDNDLRELPDWLGDLNQLEDLDLRKTLLVDLPFSMSKLEDLKRIDLSLNVLNPELAQAYEQGIDAIKSYLRAKAAAQITLNEAKLILIGEGEVGKTCLMDALLGRPWKEHDTTHGIEIKPIKVIDPDNKKEITLNGWDFGGQQVYRPTHQLFFSARLLSISWSGSRAKVRSKDSSKSGSSWLSIANPTQRFWWSPRMAVLNNVSPILVVRN